MEFCLIFLNIQNISSLAGCSLNPELGESGTRRRKLKVDFRVKNQFIVEFIK
jgi:hypothetical protein